MLEFADDLILIGNSKETEVKNTAILIDEAKTVGLEVSEKKTFVLIADG